MLAWAVSTEANSRLDPHELGWALVVSRASATASSIMARAAAESPSSRQTWQRCSAKRPDLSPLAAIQTRLHDRPQQVQRLLEQHERTLKITPCLRTAPTLISAAPKLRWACI